MNAAGVEIMSTAKNKWVWFNEQSFPRKKPSNTMRIFCLGGSTTYGHPYWDPTSYSRWLREYLPIVDPSRHFEVINAGGISYASYRVAGVMEELGQFEPDLFIVYSVHNEFLERRTYSSMFEQPPAALEMRSLLAKTRTWAAMEHLVAGHRSKWKRPSGLKSNAEMLSPEVDEMLNHTIGPIDYHRDDDWQAKVLKHYEFNLSRMVKIAENSRAKIVFLTPVSNEKNCSPFKSEFDGGLVDDEEQRLRSLLKKASGQASDGNTEKAVQLLETALQIDARCPETHFRLGQLQFSQEKFVEALKSFRRALNEDICPLRAVDTISEIIERVANRQNIPIVDFELRLRALCLTQHGHSIFGEEFFLDHVHPTIEVHQQLARWIIEDLQKHGIVNGKPIGDVAINQELEQVIAKVYSEIDSNAFGIALRNLAKVLHWAGKFDEAEPRARDALERITDDPESRFVLADCLRNTGRSEEAIAEYDQLFASGYEFERAYHPFGDLLAKEGEFRRAKAFLLLATISEPSNPMIYRTLGIVHIRLGEYELAVESLNESDRLLPEDARTLFFLAQAKVGNSEPAEAIELFERVLAKNFEPAAAHFGLGVLYLERNQRTESIDHFESALELDPTFEQAQQYLEIAK